MNVFGSMTLSTSSTNKRNNNGPRMEPCGTPLVTALGADKTVPILTDWVRCSSN